MGEWIIKLPDVGEGVAEAEIVEWNVKLGDMVLEDTVLASVMTDKATIEIPSPVIGKIIWLGAETGEVIAVGSPLIRLEVEGAGNAKDEDLSAAPKVETVPDTPKRVVEADKAVLTSNPVVKPNSNFQSSSKMAAPMSGMPRPEGESPLASPSVRLRAKAAGVDIRMVHGSGPIGRITHDDLDNFMRPDDNYQPTLEAASTGVAKPHVEDQPKIDVVIERKGVVKDIKVIGLRRKIAEKMSLSKSKIPHITYVEEIDMTALESLRAEMNSRRSDEQPKLTILPFLMKAMIGSVQTYPKMNSVFDDEAGIIKQCESIHIGVAAQTEKGLMVPVLHDAETFGLFEMASHIKKMSEAVKNGTAKRDELSGSTITVTSLGAMGGIMTTPVINHPEVAIIGTNKMQTLPRWEDDKFVPKKVMNLSSSFDHRVIDGWDAALFIQHLKSLLENPTATFTEDQ